MARKMAGVLVGLLTILGCEDRYTQAPIASAATVSKDWVEIRPPQPLKWTRPVQEVDFLIDSPHERGVRADIIGPNGEHWVPEMLLVASDGKIFTMDSHGFWGEDMFFDRGSPGDSVTIQAIRMRSGMPLRISNVRWVGYDPAKVKR